jgi:hypothetical protein
MDGWTNGWMDQWMDGWSIEEDTWFRNYVVCGHCLHRHGGICWKGLGVGGTTANWNSAHGGWGVKVMLGALVYFPIDLGACGKMLEGRTQLVRWIMGL